MYCWKRILFTVENVDKRFRIAKGSHFLENRLEHTRLEAGQLISVQTYDRAIAIAITLFWNGLLYTYFS